jgi:peptide-methionine (S)-S-oxide reductase
LHAPAASLAIFKGMVVTNGFKSFAALAVLALVSLGVTFSSSTTIAAPTADAPAGLEKATFAGGCFWCMETPFYDVAGVRSVLSGYTGGKFADPSYEQVSAGDSGHIESVEVQFDPKVISYQKLLEIFWANIDPTAQNAQFCDQGSQYRSAIFTHGAEQAKLAAASKTRWAKDSRFAGQTIHTEILTAGAFYAAEEYHQKYSLKNPTRYKYYRWNCGRDQRLKAIWGTAPQH